MRAHRILLVPPIAALLWRAVEEPLAEWADVATFDAPGVGDESRTPTLDAEAIAARGIKEIERRGWDECFVVADAWAVEPAARLAAARPDAVRGLILGHAHLALRPDGERPTVNGEVVAGFTQLARANFGSWIRALTQVSQGAIDDELADQLRVVVDPDVANAYMEALLLRRTDFEDAVAAYGGPLLLVQHAGCLLWTEEGFRDAVARFSGARTESLADAPAGTPEFAAMIREFCEAVVEPNLEARARED